MTYTRDYQIRFGPSFTPQAVRSLLIINSAIFFLQMISHWLTHSSWIEYIFALTPAKINQLFFWQLITYSFLHANFMHILFNMLALWMFGSDIEERLSTKVFVKLYFFSVFMGGIFTYVADMAGFSQGTVIGASGGIFGVLVAYAMIWPNREILFMMIFPLKTKYFVLILMLMLVFSQGGGNIAHLAHFGGAVGGFMYLYYSSRLYRPSAPDAWTISGYMKKRKLQRSQKEWNERIQKKQRVDDILDKISKSGINSLTRSEKKFLKSASKDYSETN